MVVARKLERERIWSELTAALEQESLMSVARRFGVTPGDLAAALRRTMTTRRPITGDTSGAGDSAEDGSRLADVREVQADPAPTPVVATEDAPTVPPTPPTAAPAPGATMVEHEERYRAALSEGSGDAYLAGVHHLVRIRLRRRVGGALETPDANEVSPVPEQPTALVLPHPEVETRALPDVRPTPAVPEPGVVGASNAAESVVATASPDAGQGTQLYAYEVTVLLGGRERAFAVVERTMGAAVALAASRTGGEVVRAVRGHEALT